MCCFRRASCRATGHSPHECQKKLSDSTSCTGHACRAHTALTVSRHSLVCQLHIHQIPAPSVSRSRPCKIRHLTPGLPLCFRGIQPVLNGCQRETRSHRHSRGRPARSALAWNSESTCGILPISAYCVDGRGGEEARWQSTVSAHYMVHHTHAGVSPSGYHQGGRQGGYGYRGPVVTR